MWCLAGVCLLLGIANKRIFEFPRYVIRLRTCWRDEIGHIVEVIALTCLWTYLFWFNVTGQIAYVRAARNYYWNCFLVGMCLFIPYVVIMNWKDVVGWFRHIMPVGAPLSLIIMLPIIEFFSMLIRPVALFVRMATNLCAGHIIIYILGYFGFGLTDWLGLVGFAYECALELIFVLELIVAALQSYIFVILIYLYYTDN
jgi:F-type H+-transporting ATPase subunit a